MVQELKRANDNNGDNQQVSLKELNKKAKDSQIKVIKPALTKPTDAKVVDVDIRVDMEDYKTNANDDTALYHPGSVIVTTEFFHPETGEAITSKDWFGGFRAYLQLDDTLSPIVDDNGVEEIQRYYPGTNKSGLRRFVNAVWNDMTEEEQEAHNDWIDFFFNYLPGKEVKIKSEFNTYEGQTTIKQAIVGLKK